MKTLALALTLTLTALLLALVPVLSPCQTEDATMCNWDASSRGNGIGESYVALTEDLSIHYAR